MGVTEFRSFSFTPITMLALQAHIFTNLHLTLTRWEGLVGSFHIPTVTNSQFSSHYISALTCQLTTGRSYIYLLTFQNHTLPLLNITIHTHRPPNPQLPSLPQVTCILLYCTRVLRYLKLNANIENSPISAIQTMTLKAREEARRAQQNYFFPKLAIHFLIPVLYFRG